MSRFAFYLTLTSLVLLGAVTAMPARALGTVTSLTMAPLNATPLSGTATTYAVVAKDASGSTVDVTAKSTFSTDDPLGTVSGATYTAGKVGTWTIQGVYQSLTVTTKVTVAPGVLSTLDINPNSDPEDTTIGHARRFSVLGYDAQNNLVSSPSVTWSVIGPIGTIDAAGLFQPTAPGTGKIQAKSGLVTSEVAVVVSQKTEVTTNSNANVNSSTNTNATNSAINTNSVTNTNINASNTNTSAATTVTNNETTTCKTLSTWAWVLILLLFLGAVALLYGLYPVTAIWPAASVLVVAIVLLIVQHKTACGTLAWWPWALIIGTIALTALALQMRPRKPLLS